MVVILKIPFDIGNIDHERRGSAEAPEAISKLFPKVKQVDVKVDPSNFEITQRNIEVAAKKEKKFIGIGGDHSVTFGLIKAISSPNLSLIYFDAHLDCEDSLLPPSHEDIIRVIINEGLVKPENLLIFGARKWWPKEEKFIKDKRIKVTSDPKELIEFASKSKKIYISVDIDVFDPSEAPGTGYPELKGVKSAVFFKLIDAIEKLKLVGADITEVAPRLDKTQKTVYLAAKIVEKFLTL